MPTDRPRQATTQTLAAVVSPRTVNPSRKIAPAPRKPMPLMTCAPSRAGSEGVVPNTAIVCSYMMQLVTMTTHEPSATRICVRIPAGCEVRARCAPTANPTITAPSSRSTISTTVIFPIFVSLLSKIFDRTLQWQGTVRKRERDCYGYVLFLIASSSALLDFAPPDNLPTPAIPE